MSPRSAASSRLLGSSLASESPSDPDAAVRRASRRRHHRGGVHRRHRAGVHAIERDERRRDHHREQPDGDEHRDEQQHRAPAERAHRAPVADAHDGGQHVGDDERQHRGLQRRDPQLAQWPGRTRDRAEERARDRVPEGPEGETHYERAERPRGEGRVAERPAGAAQGGARCGGGAVGGPSVRVSVQPGKWPRRRRAAGRIGHRLYSDSQWNCRSASWKCRAERASCTCTESPRITPSSRIVRASGTA